MIYDISPLLKEGFPVWPGDTPFSCERREEIAEGASTNVSRLSTTVHLGSHTDAPLHCLDGEKSIDEVALEHYLGPCQLIRVSVAKGKAILPADIQEKIKEKRVIIATGTYDAEAAFSDDFSALSVELIAMFREHGVISIGIDTPSVDLADSETLPVHLAAIDAGMAIIEGLSIRDVPAGSYELIALPLKLQGSDGSPLRAVLRSPL